MTKILLDALRGLPTPRRPLWIMRQAGRYLPEYRALKAEHSFVELARTPELAAAVTLQPLARFPLDAAIVFADLVSPVAAFGIEVEFAPGPVLARRIASRADIAALPRPRAGEIAPEVAATLALVRPRLDPGVALLGFAGAPMSLAAYLVAGQHERDFASLRALAASDAVAFTQLLDRLVELLDLYVADQVRAGAEAIQIFESWAGLLAPAAWRRLVRPALAELMSRLGRLGVPRILFVHGAPHLVADYAALECEAIAVDWRTPIDALAGQVAGRRAVQGNLDPAVLLAGPDATRAGARELLASLPARGHIVNLGHGILPETPLESVAALIDVVHAEGGRR